MIRNGKIEPAPQTWARVIGKRHAPFAFDSDHVDFGSFGVTGSTASSIEHGTVAVDAGANGTDTTVADTLGAGSTELLVPGRSMPDL